MLEKLNSINKIITDAKIAKLKDSGFKEIVKKVKEKAVKEAKAVDATELINRAYNTIEEAVPPSLTKIIKEIIKGSPSVIQSDDIKIIFEYFMKENNKLIEILNDYEIPPKDFFKDLLYKITGVISINNTFTITQGVSVNNEISFNKGAGEIAILTLSGFEIKTNQNFVMGYESFFLLMINVLGDNIITLNKPFGLPELLSSDGGDEAKNVKDRLIHAILSTIARNNTKITTPLSEQEIINVIDAINIIISDTANILNEQLKKEYLHYFLKMENKDIQVKLIEQFPDQETDINNFFETNLDIPLNVDTQGKLIINGGMRGGVLLTLKDKIAKYYGFETFDLLNIYLMGLRLSYQKILDLHDEKTGYLLDKETFKDDREKQIYETLKQKATAQAEDKGAVKGAPTAEGKDAPTAAVPDAGLDAGLDAAAAAGLDAGLDAAAVPDAGLDAGLDAAAAAGLDAVAGTATGTGADAAKGTVTDASKGKKEAVKSTVTGTKKYTITEALKKLNECPNLEKVSVTVSDKGYTVNKHQIHMLLRRICEKHTIKELTLNIPGLESLPYNIGSLFQLTKLHVEGSNKLCVQETEGVSAEGKPEKGKGAEGTPEKGKGAKSVPTKSPKPKFSYKLPQSLIDLGEVRGIKIQTKITKKEGDLSSKGDSPDSNEINIYIKPPVVEVKGQYIPPIDDIDRKDYADLNDEDKSFYMNSPYSEKEINKLIMDGALINRELIIQELGKKKKQIENEIVNLSGRKAGSSHSVTNMSKLEGEIQEKRDIRTQLEEAKEAKTDTVFASLTGPAKDIIVSVLINSKDTAIKPKRIQYQECLEKANEMEERLYELKEMDELLFKIKGGFTEEEKKPTYITETDDIIVTQRGDKTYADAVFEGELKHDELSLDELGRITNVLETLGLKTTK